jgi:hypothetical protein
MNGIRYGLQIHKGANADIREILQRDGRVGGQIVAFLQELEVDQALLDSLNLDGYEDDRITVRMVVRLQHDRWNAWRLTLRDLEPPEGKLPYRILYAFDHVRLVYHVLAVAHRSTAYDDEILDRVCAACESLGIPRLPRA